MKNVVKLLGIAALVAVIGFSIIACDNGTGGGGGRRGPGTPSGPVTPSGPLSAEYVSYEADGTEYKLVITETVTGRAAYDPKTNDAYTLTISKDGIVIATSTGTVVIGINSETQEIEITLKHTGGGEIVVTVSGDGSTMISFSDAIPVDGSDVPVPKPQDLPYALNEEGTGYIVLKGIVKQNGEANLDPFLGKPVTAIGGGAFENNTDLRSVTIPASVTDISGWNNFLGCTNLATVTFAAGSKLEHIGGAAFADCTSLTGITIPASVTAIGNPFSTPNDEWGGTFQRCTSLATVIFAEGSRLQYIGRGTFEVCTSLTSITIPAGVTSIGGTNDWAVTFQDCTSLETVIFAQGSRLEAIGRGVFSRCTSLTSITIPAGVTTILDRAFVGCTSLAGVTFAEGFSMTIGDWFSGLPSLTSVTIPNSVTSIGDSAFSYWTSPEKVDSKVSP